jgi:putative tricarboxylic transport membrane protein
MKRDLLCAALLLAIAAAYYGVASGIGRSALADEVGPAGLPLAYAMLLGALGLALAVKAIAGLVLERATANAAEPPDRAQPTRVVVRAAGTLAIGAAYVAIVSVLGYWLSIMLLLPAMAGYQGQTGWRRLALVAVVGATAFWALFVWLLGIPMPQPWFRG